MAAERRVCSYSAGTVSLYNLILCLFKICFEGTQVVYMMTCLLMSHCLSVGNKPHIPVQQRDDLV